MKATLPEHLHITSCRSCGAPVLFCFTARGKLCPFDLPAEGEPVDLLDTGAEVELSSHFATCPLAKTWTKKGKRP
jgi:hypothetical protein